jgi:hypothetical protein
VRIRLILACLSAVAASVLVYLQAIDAPFVYDDLRLIDENRALRDISDVRTLVLSNVSRPLVAVSYALDRAFWGPAPFGFHVTNLALHAVNVLLIFIVAHGVATDRHRWSSAGGPAPVPAFVAWVAALLLAVHPIATEAVIYITGRADLLASSFTLLAFLLVRRWLITHRTVWFVTAVASWVVGMFAKEAAFVFPFLLAAYIWILGAVPLDARQRASLRWLAALGALLVIVRLGLFFAMEYGTPVSLQWNLAATQLDVFRRYLVLLVAPQGQTIFHVVPAFSGWLDLRLWGSAAVMGGLVLWIRLVRTRVPLAAWGMVWFLLALVPPVVLILLDRGEPMAERRVYLPACGAFLAVAALVGRVQLRLSARGVLVRAAAGLGFAVVLLSLSGRTVERTQIWGNRIWLWTEAARFSPSHWVPALALGEALHLAGRHAEAIEAFERSIAVHATEPATYTKLGVCFVEMGRLEEAERTFRRLDQLERRSAPAANGLATVALAAGDLALARQRFLHTLEFDPLNVEARTGLATVARSQDDTPEWRLRCQEIALLAPRDPTAAVCFALPHDDRAGPPVTPLPSSR